MVDRMRGVTLLELLVVLGLFGVFAGAATPYFAAMRSGLEARSSALRVAGALTRARFGALAENHAWRVRVVGPSTLEVGREGAPPAVERLAGRARFLSFTSGGDVRFRPDGWAENATFTVVSGREVRRVVVNQRGRVSVRAGVSS